MVTKLTTYVTDNTIPYKNLAIEKFLTFHVQPSECILFLWQNRQTVVIGKNQNAWKECKVQRLEADGGYLVRRLSGGGAVFHDLGNLNFTFCVREEDYDVARQTEVILRAVLALGIDAKKTGRNDITVDGRKFSGHAFYKSKGFCYHHGTLLVDVNQSKMANYLNVSAAKLKSKGVDSVRSRTINLKELRPDLTIELLEEKLIAAFEEVYSNGESSCEKDSREKCSCKKDRCESDVVHVNSWKASELSEERLDWEEIAEAEQEFASWDWKYGRKIPFEHSMERRFSWGGLEVQFHVIGGIIQETRIYSDAMEEAFTGELEALWTGCPYDFSALMAQLAHLKIDSENEFQIKQDIRQLLAEQFSA